MKIELPGVTTKILNEINLGASFQEFSLDSSTHQQFLVKPYLDEVMVLPEISAVEDSEPSDGVDKSDMPLVKKPVKITKPETQEEEQNKNAISISASSS